MMFFKPEMRKKIIAGQKTATRRSWKRSQVIPGGTYKVRRAMYSTDYYFLIKVTKVYRQKLGDMSEEDAIKEGFNSLTEFRAYWATELEKSYDPNEEVVVVEFQYLGDK